MTPLGVGLLILAFGLLAVALVLCRQREPVYYDDWEDDDDWDDELDLRDPYA